MRFEYNGNLLEIDRISLVVKEILELYPQISPQKAYKAAMLEGRITKEKNINDELNRLYNLMLVNCNNRDIVLLIYKDFLNLIKNSKTSEYSNYICLVDEINDFIENNAEFPILDDYQ